MAKNTPHFLALIRIALTTITISAVNTYMFQTEGDCTIQTIKNIKLWVNSFDVSKDQ
jgi:hypothetical protein